MRWLVFLVALACLSPMALVRSQAPNSYLYPSSDTSWVLELRAEDGTHLAHYVEATQYFENVGVSALFGEVNLRNTQGDTLLLPFDCVDVDKFFSPRYLIYDTNTVNFAMALYTRKFTINSGDTIFYHFSPSYIFPRVGVSGDTATFEDDSTLFAINDSVLFVVQLIDGESYDVIEALDTLLFTPVHAIDSMLVAIKGLGGFEETLAELEKGYVPDPAYCGGEYRLQLNPEYLPQRYGDFHDRVMYAKYFWAERYSEILKDTARSMGYLKQSVRSVQRKDLDVVLEILPNIIDRKSSGTVHLKGNWQGYSTVNISIHDVLGRTIFEQIVKSDSFGVVLVRLNHERLSPGNYIVRATHGGDVRTGSIKVF